MLPPLTPVSDPSHGDAAAAVARLVRLYEHLTPAQLDALAACYAPQAQFKDPFNDVTGLPGIQRVFAHMFETVQNPRFVVHHTMTQGEHAWLTWDFLIEPDPT